MLNLSLKHITLSRQLSCLDHCIHFIILRKHVTAQLWEIDYSVGRGKGYISSASEPCEWPFIYPVFSVKWPGF